MTFRSAVACAALLAACQGSALGKPPPDAAPPRAPPVPVRAAPREVTDEDYPMPPLPKGRVRLTDAFGGTHVVEVEIATTNDQRTRGLMWRRSLESGKGMLFLFQEEALHNFWMRNTLIPLDLLFLDGKFRIVGIVENAEPKTLDPRGPGRPSQYVLEVPGGWAQLKGLKAGLTASFEGTQGLPVDP